MKNDKTYLRHMLIAIEEIVLFAQRGTRDLKTLRVLKRTLEMIGMRHKLIHDYFGVHADVAWATAKEDLPELKQNIRNSLKETHG